MPFNYSLLGQFSSMRLTFFIFTSGVVPHLESAERVLLGEVHRWDVVVEVALARAPEGLQLVPFGQDGVALVVEQRGCGQSAGRVDELIRLRLGLGLLTKQTSYSTNNTHTHQTDNLTHTK